MRTNKGDVFTGDSTDQVLPVGSSRGLRSYLQRCRTYFKRYRNVAVPTWIPYAFLFPFFIIFGTFMLYPILDTLYLSFMNWTSTSTTFVGLKNYLLVITDSNFWNSLLNDAFVLLIQVPVMLFLAILLAVALHSKGLRLKWLFRLVIFMPVLVDLVTYSIAFQMIFNTSFGVLNYLLHFIGVTHPIDWIGGVMSARVAVIIAVTWRWTGYNAIIVLSGLQSVPEDIYESARVDGAGRIRTLFQITVPMLKPVLLFCAVLSTVGTLQLFTEPYILTGGGPVNATMTPMLYLYNMAFQNFNFGLASAGTYILTTIIAILSYIQMRVTNGGQV